MSDYHALFHKLFNPASALAYRFPHPNPTFHNPVWEEAQEHILIVRLSPFQDVDCSIGHFFLFHTIRSLYPHAYIDLAFFPNALERRLLTEHNLPFLLGMDSMRTVTEFDLLLISNACTLELINLPFLFLRSDIPLMSSERLKHTELFPPFLLGGSNALVTQSLITETGDSLVDGIFFGEGEQAVGEILHLYFDPLKGGAVKARKRLQSLAGKVPGLWLAGNRQTPVVKKIYQPVQAEELPVCYPLLGREEADTARLQISYGCPFQCTFCLDGCQRRPYREMPLVSLLEKAAELKKNSGADTLELMSFNFNTYSEIESLIAELNKLYYQVNFMSQRLDILNRSPELLKFEIMAGKSSFALGIEGISERMRLFYNKKLTINEIDVLLSKLLREKIREIKLFYMLSGYEQPQDFEEFKEFVDRLRAEQENMNPGVRIIFSFNWLVRMPFTPLRYADLLLDENDALALMKQAQASCRNAGIRSTNARSLAFDFRVASSWAEYAVTQVLASGGYWLHGVLIHLAASGHCYDKNLPDKAWTDMKAWLEEQGHLSQELLGEKSEADSFPLEFIQYEGKEQLIPSKLYELYTQAKQAINAFQAETAEPKRSRGNLHISLATKTGSDLSATSGNKRKTVNAKDFSNLIKAKQKLLPLYGRFILPATCAGASFEWLNTWLLQEICNDFPTLVSNLLSSRENHFSALWEKKNKLYWHGETVFALRAWDQESLARTLDAGHTFSGQTRFSGWLNEYTPGLFQNAEIIFQIQLPGLSDFMNRLSQFCTQNHIPVTLKRTATGYSMQISNNYYKKKFIYSGEVCLAPASPASHPEKELFTGSLQVGAKFDFISFWSFMTGQAGSVSYPCQVNQLRF
jgi:hypothetical protein